MTTTDDVLVRLTPQRRAVLDVLRASSDHPTAAEVYERVRVSSPGIGAATVYRSLSLLVDAQLARELLLGEGAGTRRYDANTGRHDHLVCDRCGSASDVEAPLLDEAVRQVSAATGFHITTYDLQFRGLCSTCST